MDFLALLLKWYSKSITDPSSSYISRIWGQDSAVRSLAPSGCLFGVDCREERCTGRVLVYPKCLASIACVYVRSSTFTGELKSIKSRSVYILTCFFISKNLLMQ
ncbi:hypothetical protein Dimus_027425 [Dionaea muscipula]